MIEIGLSLCRHACSYRRGGGDWGLRRVSVGTSGGTTTGKEDAFSDVRFDVVDAADLGWICAFHWGFLRRYSFWQ